MKPPQIARLLIILWVVATVLSFALPALLTPKGDGFTRGLNRLESFMVWQAIAIVAALFSALYAKLSLRDDPAWRRRGYRPLWGQLLVFLLIAGLVGYATIRTNSPAETPPQIPTKPATAAVQEAPANPEREIDTFQGIYRSGFEASHFYTFDGRGPWWLQAEGANWETLQSHFVERPGRGGGVTVAVTLSGWLDEPGSDLDHIGSFEHRIQVVSIDLIRGITPEEFNQILGSIRANKK